MRLLLYERLAPATVEHEFRKGFALARRHFLLLHLIVRKLVGGIGITDGNYGTYLKFGRDAGDFASLRMIEACHGMRLKTGLSGLEHHVCQRGARVMQGVAIWSLIVREVAARGCEDEDGCILGPCLIERHQNA